MRILFVSPKFPYPPKSGSAIFSSRYLEHLSKNHSVDLISFDTEQSVVEIQRTLAFPGKIQAIPILSRTKVLLNAAVGFWEGLPLPVTHYSSLSAQRLVSGMLVDGAYDMAVFQLLEMAQFLPTSFTHAATVLSMEDPMSLKNERWLPFIHSFPLRLRTRLEISRLRKYERLKTPLFDRTILINQADAEAFCNLTPDARVAWAPYGVDTAHFSPDDSLSRKPGMIVISGTMSHPPNVEGIRYFCREVFPLVCAKNRHAELYLVGAHPIPEIAALAGPNIHVIGSVPDMRLYLRQAMVSVCPVRLKIGTQTKVLEAMASGTPVVTTSAGNNGVEAISNLHAYVTDSPTEMADYINILFLDKEKWQFLAQNARQFTVKHFDWAVSCARFEQILISAYEEKQIKLKTP